jgi:hypothetical protein
VLRDGVDPDIAVAMLVGSYYAAYLESGRPGGDWEDRAVDSFLAGETG